MSTALTELKTTSPPPSIPASHSAPALTAWDPTFRHASPYGAPSAWPAGGSLAAAPTTLPEHLQLRPALRPTDPVDYPVYPATAADWTYAPGGLSQQHQQRYPLPPASDYVSPLKAALHSAARVTGLPPASLLAEGSVRTTAPTGDWRSLAPSTQDPLDAVFDRLRQSGVQLTSSIGTASRA